MATSVKSLANHCLDLRYSRPNKDTIARRCVEVARLEGLAVDHNAVVELSESMGGDIRQVLNALQVRINQSINQSIIVQDKCLFHLGQHLQQFHSFFTFKHTWMELVMFVGFCNYSGSLDHLLKNM